MNLYIPEIGDHICLTADWTFKLYSEYRNNGVLGRLGLTYNYSPEIYARDDLLESVIEKAKEDGWEIEEAQVQNPWNDGLSTVYRRFIGLTLPAGTVMSVDRIYIRKGQGEYSSLTFNILQCSLKELEDKKGPRRRFWAKLADVNTIEFSKAD